MAQSNPYPLRVDKMVMDKFKVISSSNGRSVNKELEMMMKSAINEFEKINGTIHVSNLEE